MRSILFASLFLLASCSQTQNSKEVPKEDSAALQQVLTEGTHELNPTEAKTWLQKEVVAFLNENGFENNIFTETYESYKTDAILVDLDEGLTLSEFKDKWKAKFDVEKAGVGVGYFISAQDYNEIKVASCSEEKVEKDALWFALDLVDSGSNEHFKSDVKVILENGAYKIADVKM